jgi:hypothetical protein
MIDCLFNNSEHKRIMESTYYHFKQLKTVYHLFSLAVCSTAKSGKVNDSFNLRRLGSDHANGLFLNKNRCIFKRFSALNGQFWGQNGQFNEMAA